MDLRVIIILAAEALLAVWLLYREKLLGDPVRAAAAIALVAAAFVLRGLVFSYETLDYQDFLTKWVAYYRDNGGFLALRESVGNYNIPYLYFLALFSYLDIKDLYLIKLLSVFFDVVLAWAALRLAARFTDSPARRLSCFIAVLYLPTVFLNGSVWGQCDSTYAALALLGVCLALEDRPVLSMVCAALSFGFKLQAVFILPVYAVLWMYGKFNWKHFLVFPLTYVLLVLPAVLLGRPFLDTLTLYLRQTGSIGDALNYNSSSIFAFFRNISDAALASKLGVIAAFALMGLILAAAWLNRARLSDRAVLGAALLFAIGIPFLLPHMHERYFFVADILAVVLAFSCPEFAVTAVLTQFASLLGYHAYLKMRYLLPMRYGSCALVLAFILSLFFFLTGLSSKKEKKPEIRP